MLELIKDLSEFFKTYDKVPQITATLNDKDLIISKLKLQLRDEFSLFLKGMSNQSNEVIEEACILIEIIGVEFKEAIIKMIVDNIITPYREIFNKRDSRTLESIDKRFAWFSRNFNETKIKYGKIFPHYWGVLSYLVIEFCSESCISVSEILMNL